MMIFGLEGCCGNQAPPMVDKTNTIAIDDLFTASTTVPQDKDYLPQLLSFIDELIAFVEKQKYKDEQNQLARKQSLEILGLWLDNKADDTDISDVQQDIETWVDLVQVTEDGYVKQWEEFSTMVVEGVIAGVNRYIVRIASTVKDLEGTINAPVVRFSSPLEGLASDWFIRKASTNGNQVYEYMAKPTSLSNKTVFVFNPVDGEKNNYKGLLSLQLSVHETSDESPTAPKEQAYNREQQDVFMKKLISVGSEVILSATIVDSLTLLLVRLKSYKAKLNLYAKVKKPETETKWALTVMTGLAHIIAPIESLQFEPITSLLNKELAALMKIRDQAPDKEAEPPPADKEDSPTEDSSSDTTDDEDSSDDTDEEGEDDMGDDMEEGDVGEEDDTEEKEDE